MIDRFPAYYILVDRVPFAVDLMTWARWFEEDYGRRRVARTVIDEDLGVYVSTVFLGMDHGFVPGEQPVLFETMAFGPSDEPDYFGKFEARASLGEMRRYCSWKEAEAGHLEVVAEITAMLEDIRRSWSWQKSPGTQG